MTTRPNIVGPEFIADLLGIMVSTVKIDAARLSLASSMSVTTTLEGLRGACIA